MRLDERMARVVGLVASIGGQNGPLPERVCVACAATLPIDGAGVQVKVNGNLPIGYSSDDATAGLLHLEETLGDGPGIDAYASGGPILLSDLENGMGERWPLFRSGALSAGVGAIFLIPLQIGAIRVGVLYLFREEAGPLSAAALDDAMTFADVATLAVLRAGGDSEAGDLESWAKMVMGTQAVVHQATGMVLAQLGVDAATALVRIRAHAFVAGLSVTTVAREIVGRRLDFRGEGPTARDNERVKE